MISFTIRRLLEMKENVKVVSRQNECTTIRIAEAPPPAAAAQLYIEN